MRRLDDLDPVDRAPATAGSRALEPFLGLSSGMYIHTVVSAHSRRSERSLTCKLELTSDPDSGAVGAAGADLGADLGADPDGYTVEGGGAVGAHPGPIDFPKNFSKNL